MFLTKEEIKDIQSVNFQTAVKVGMRVHRHLLKNNAFSKRLAGACSHWATLTCCVLDDFSVFRGGTFTHINGCYGKNSKNKCCMGHPHYWIVVDDYNICGTATQFGSYPKLTVTYEGCLSFQPNRKSKPKYVLKSVIQTYLYRANAKIPYLQAALPPIDPKITIPRMREFLRR